MGEARRSLVAADGSASAGIAAPRRSDGYDQHDAPGLRDHEPVGWRLGRIEQRVVGPDVEDVVHPQVRMLEQVRGLGVDLEGLLAEKVRIKPVSHGPSV